MNQYEVTFIVDPVLSDSEMKATSQNYVDHLKNEGCTIVHVDELGLKQLAYAIKRRNSGFYYTVEFQSEKADFIAKMELALRRDERIIRFLTVKLDKFGIKYNEDKRNGLINKRERKVDTKKDSRGGFNKKSNTDKQPAKPAPVKSEKVEAAVTEKVVTPVADKVEAPVAEKVEAPIAAATAAVAETAESVVSKTPVEESVAAATETTAETVEAVSTKVAEATEVVEEKIAAKTEEE